MRIGMVGLGKMGGRMTERLIRAGHEVVVYDRNQEALEGAVIVTLGGVVSTK